MKWMDENGRLFGKISILDVLAILIVAVLAAALSFKGGQTHTGTSTAAETITYQVWVRAARDYVADAIQVGDRMFDVDRASGGSIGTIVQIEEMPARRLAELQDGSAAYVPVEDSVDLLLTVEGEGLISDGRYLLNRIYDLGVNSSRNYYTKFAQFTGVVASIG